MTEIKKIKKLMIRNLLYLKELNKSKNKTKYLKYHLEILNAIDINEEYLDFCNKENINDDGKILEFWIKLDNFSKYLMNLSHKKYNIYKK